MSKVDVCSKCNGMGRVFVKIEELLDDDPADSMICPECDGTGVPYDD